LQGKQFSVREVEVVTATSYRGAMSSLQEQASAHRPHPHIAVPFRVCSSSGDSLLPTSPIEPRYHVPEQEIALGVSPRRGRNLLPPVS